MPESPPRPLPPRHVIREVEQLRALRTPARQQILDAIQTLGPCSVTELAERIGRKRASVYYHVHELADVGLVVRTGERPAGGRRHEALFEAVARDVEVDPSIRSPRFLEALGDAYRAALRSCERHLERALRLERHGAGPRRDTAVRQWTIRLGSEQREELDRHIRAIARLVGEHDPNATAEPYSLTIALSRVADH